MMIDSVRRSRTRRSNILKEMDGLLVEAKLASAAWNMVSTVGKPAVVDAVTPDSTYKPSAGSASLENGIYVSLIRDAANLDVEGYSGGGLEGI